MGSVHRGSNPVLMHRTGFLPDDCDYSSVYQMLLNCYVIEMKGFPYKATQEQTGVESYWREFQEDQRSCRLGHWFEMLWASVATVWPGLPGLVYTSSNFQDFLDSYCCFINCPWNSLGFLPFHPVNSLGLRWTGDPFDKIGFLLYHWCPPGLIGQKHLVLGPCLT